MREDLSAYRRAGWFTFSLLAINLVGDGWSGRPGGVAHQLLVLPVTLGFLLSAARLVSSAVPPEPPTAWSPKRALKLVACFQGAATVLFAYECFHFRVLGYRFHPFAILTLLILALVWASWKLRPAMGSQVFALGVATYAVGLGLAIFSFPLNYLRSDMLPVILWADTQLLHGISPYATMYVGGRVYDFPYLPGILIGYLPFVAAQIDVRFGSLVYVTASAALIFWAARSDRRLEVAALIALFLLCPFLQYRHELYLAPHWFTMAMAFVLMRRRRFAWAAVALGASMAIYQFSWLLFPFFALNPLRRRGWVEMLKLTSLSLAGALSVAGPFLFSAAHRIAGNTVSQWSLLPHALADPMNLSFWATFVIRPDKLLVLQALLMIALFFFCLTRNRCLDVADTLRWMTVALTVFILFNVLVDGYFYLMLLVPMLAFTCVENDWWSDPEAASP